jgi:hypothetical protein
MLLHWIITSGRRKTVRGNYTMAKITLNPFIRSITSLRAVEMEVHIGMEATSTKSMVATSMATGTMEDSGETAPMAITMVTTVGTMNITMEEMDNVVSTPMPRRISPMSHASSVRRLGITPPAAQRTSQMMQLSSIHSRRDR